MNKWNAKNVVRMLQREHPALIECISQKLTQREGGYVSLPDSSPTILKTIVYELILPHKKVNDRFHEMGVEFGDWYGLHKKTYEWVKSQENINEIMAFKLL
ncbi:hypothetical protein KAU11_09680 [Candidatus Babeliales bacterium]|nr:hypothetical protein [Candidatus Babeliales bacterium]